MSQSMPKFVQGCQLASCDELEVLVSPEGILPILEFLRDHTNGQFKQLMDMTAVDVPSRPYRFEVLLPSSPLILTCSKHGSFVRTLF